MTQKAKILIELFKRKKYREIAKLVKLSDKQTEAFINLCDNETKEVLYGGGAGGGKSWLGCFWIVLLCEAYPGVKYFIGRKRLNDLIGSTSITLKKVCKKYGFDTPDFNSKYNWFLFSNGSQIDYKELRYRPEDPLFERLGSIEYTGGWIEEGGEVPFEAFDTLKTRIGRHLNRECNLISKIFITCNPKKNWLYKKFYRPFIEGILKKGRVFIRALATDNPYLPKDYIENLENTEDKAKRERLLFGNWEYDDDPSCLIDDYDKIMDLFTNSFVESGNKYIVADIARFGEDKARIFVFDGWRMIDRKSFDKSKTTDISLTIKKFQKDYKVSNSRTLVDSDGVGGGVMDEVGCLGFINNSRPIPIPGNSNYDNLKSQCGFHLAEKVNSAQVYIDPENISPTEKEEIIQEFEQLKSKEESEGKKGLNPKSVMKQYLGRSTDWLDPFIMRSYFDLVPKKKGQKVL